MSETRAALRAKLARAVQRYFAGAATGGSTTTIVDTSGLERWSETDALKGAYALITEADSAAPEGESARIKSFNPTSNTITFDTALSAAVEAGDSYELYLAPLALDDWNQCINVAIQAAWPEVWEREVTLIKDLFRWPVYAMPSDCEEILEVWAYPWGSTEEADISDGGPWLMWSHGFTPQRFPRAVWRQEGAPGTDLNLRLLRRVGPGEVQIHVYYRKRYATLTSDTATTDLDPAYLLAAARGEWYQMMADAGRGQADRSALLQLMNHWQQVATQRKQALGAQLLGLPALAQGKGK